MSLWRCVPVFPLPHFDALNPMIRHRMRLFLGACIVMTGLVLAAQNTSAQQLIPGQTQAQCSALGGQIRTWTNTYGQGVSVGECYVPPRAGDSSGYSGGTGYSGGEGMLDAERLGILGSALQGIFGALGNIVESERQQRLQNLRYQGRNAHEEGRRLLSLERYEESMLQFELAAQYFQQAGDDHNMSVAKQNADRVKYIIDLNRREAERQLNQKEQWAIEHKRIEEANREFERKFFEPLGLVTNADTPPAKDSDLSNAAPIASVPARPPAPAAPAVPAITNSDRSLAHSASNALFSKDPFGSNSTADLRCPAQPTTREDISNCYVNIRNQMTRNADTCSSNATAMTSIGTLDGGPSNGQRHAFEACMDLNRRGALYADCVASGIRQPNAQYNPLVRACGEKHGFVEGDRVVTKVLEESSTRNRAPVPGGASGGASHSVLEGYRQSTISGPSSGGGTGAGAQAPLSRSAQ
ncbi:hypothetical protein [Pacificispira sp.]|uniref:hypothetical protein n=1 Tax=Pacificispira sp. TaxID=2888761 RepID=UPI003B518F35